jgi:hypothetical protein
VPSLRERAAAVLEARRTLDQGRNTLSSAERRDTYWRLTNLGYGLELLDLEGLLDRAERGLAPSWWWEDHPRPRRQRRH